MEGGMDEHLGVGSSPGHLLRTPLVALLSTEHGVVRVQSSCVLKSKQEQGVIKIDWISIMEGSETARDRSAFS